MRKKREKNHVDQRGGGLAKSHFFRERKLHLGIKKELRLVALGRGGLKMSRKCFGKAMKERHSAVSDERPQRRGGCTLGTKLGEGQLGEEFFAKKKSKKSHKRSSSH